MKQATIAGLAEWDYKTFKNKDLTCEWAFVPPDWAGAFRLNKIYACQARNNHSDTAAKHISRKRARQGYALSEGMVPVKPLPPKSSATRAVRLPNPSNYFSFVRTPYAE